MKTLDLPSCVILLTLAAASAPARAEIFVLHNDAQVRGELVNRDEKPRKTYVIKTSSGGELTLEADQVREVKRQSATEMKYDQIRSKYPDTVEGQWKLAEWCRENRLPKQRKVHAERVVQLDANHVQARHALGFSQIQGRWITQANLMTENGYVRYANKWVLPQEIEILEQRRKETLADKDWGAKLKTWQRWFDTDKQSMAEENIHAINDPFAAKALSRSLANERRRNVRALYVESLGRLADEAGMDALVDASLYDSDDEIRAASLDQVVNHQYKPAVGKYIQALKNKNNDTVNRAGDCLGHMKDSSAVGPLIDALVTTHTFQIQRGQPGGMSSTFGNGPGMSGGSFSFGGGGVETIKQNVENRSVLLALSDLTGGVNFNFDTRAWKYWYAAQKKPQSLDSRRDGASE